MNLIFPVLVELKLIDHAATAAAGNYVRGRRQVALENKNDGSPRVKKVEEVTVKALAQYESASHRQTNWTPAGDAPRTNAGWLFDEEDLAERGLINPANNLPVFKTGDRVVAWFDKDTEEPLVKLDAPGIKIVSVAPLDRLPGFPLLYLAQLEDRPQGGMG
jgi:hypothetical protein